MRDGCKGIEFPDVTESADSIIDAIIKGSPSHTAGTRPIHAPGMLVSGRFQPSEVASTFTDAAHFSGPPVPVTARFSSGTGSMDVPDSEPLVRGMAVKFHLGQAGLAGDVVDMVAMTLPVFFTPTMASFMDFLGAIRYEPGPPPSTGRLGKLRNVLRLLPEPSRPLGRSEVAAIGFADKYPPSRRSVLALTALGLPQSFVTCTYHAVHAFVLRAGGHPTAVRFRWEPAAGVRPAPEKTKGNYLQEELRDRLARGPAEFVLRMQVAEHGDDTSDPTRPWPETRRRVVMGHLRIDSPVTDQVDGNERLTFDPTRLVPGIEVGDDPILLARREVYQRSFARRLAHSPG